ncbi:hypothetical protein VNO77_43750 [Canavalia gladiata]|uniref:Uncharacterized protein n=1 Tax=Canavalia gladiata TaxID=3824 RepID=A0AAN9PQA9_CANGL
MIRLLIPHAHALTPMKDKELERCPNYTDADLSLYWTKEWLFAEFVLMPVVPCKIEISRLVPKQIEE